MVFAVGPWLVIVGQETVEAPSARRLTAAVFSVKDGNVEELHSGPFLGLGALCLEVGWLVDSGGF